MKNKIKKFIHENLRVSTLLLEDDVLGEVKKAIRIILSSLEKGKKVLVCGNGGSAAQAQHMAAELVGRFKKERRGLPAIALTSDTSIITALGNDYSFERIFERQVEAIGKKGDILLSLSTSGNSVNIIRAVEKADKLGIKTISLLGKGGGRARKISYLSIVIPSNNSARVQEAHIFLIHIICELIEETI